MDRQGWNAILEEELPGEYHAVARNLAVTSRYASWYLEKPELFKWAGMAAFASRQVGLALVLFELLHTPSLKPEAGHGESGISGFFDAMLQVPATVASSLHAAAAERLLLADLDVIRKGNNSIYRDIAWAHAAYLYGGIPALESGCAEADREFMLAGFRMIDEGRRLLESEAGSGEAGSLIREGNILLLRHEQYHTLQPLFDTVSSAGRVAVSFGSELDFSCGEWNEAGRKASFAGFSGYFETLGGKRSITSAPDRWTWIESEVLPAWEAADSSFSEGSALHRQMLSMALRKSDPVRSAAMALSAFHPGAGPGR